MQPKRRTEFEFVLFDGFSNLVLSCALEPLRDVKLREGRNRADWTISTWDGKQVTSSSGVVVLPDTRFNPARPGKRIVLVAGYGVRELTDEQHLTDLRLAAQHVESIIALDSAAWLVAGTGLLDGRSATIHWQELEDFRDTYPRVDVASENFVRAGKILTCGGASSALDLILETVKEMFGAQTALSAANMFIFNPEKSLATGSDYPDLRKSQSPLLQAAIRLIWENLETPLTNPELAQAVGVSARTLNRVFERELQTTPSRYAAHFRLKQAEYFAKTTDLSLAQIALRCGYSSAPVLSRAYKESFKIPLREKIAGEG